jgi:hypothetical protein
MYDAMGLCVFQRGFESGPVIESAVPALNAVETIQPGGLGIRANYCMYVMSFGHEPARYAGSDEAVRANNQDSPHCARGRHGSLVQI